MKKRLLATVLAGAMVLSMAACGSSNANKTESAADPKLRMLQQKPEQKAVKHRQLLRKVMQALS